MDDLLREKEFIFKNSPQMEPIERLLPPLLCRESDTDTDTEEEERLKELSNDELKDLVAGFRQELLSISKGERQCQRHQLYNQGGADKASLEIEIGYGPFSESQLEVVCDTLRQLFCHRIEMWQYTLKVLLPEVLLMIIAEVENVSHERAEQILLRYEDQHGLDIIC